MTVSNETGAYILPNLPVGPYRLEATLPGFRTFLQTGIILQVNSNPAIKITLQIGQLAETIKCTPMARWSKRDRRESARLSRTHESSNYRLSAARFMTSSLFPVQQFQTGVAQTTNRAAYPGRQTFSIAGSLNTGNTVTLDGAMHNDVASNTALPLPLS